MKLFADKLFEELLPEERVSIGRITVLKTSDPFVRDMTNLYPVLSRQGGMPVPHVTAGDVDEGAGFLFYSQPQVAA